MTKRRLLLIALFATVMLLSVWALWPRTAITREDAARIREGMTLGEVEAILGGPARDESSGAPIADDDDAFDPKALPVPPRQQRMAEMRFHIGDGILEWRSDLVVVSVVLDSDGRVSHYCDQHTRRDYESISDMLRRWLGL
jgi:hypothetical protein